MLSVGEEEENEKGVSRMVGCVDIWGRGDQKVGKFHLEKPWGANRGVCKLAWDKERPRLKKPDSLRSR